MSHQCSRGRTRYSRDLPPHAARSQSHQTPLLRVLTRLAWSYPPDFKLRDEDSARVRADLPLHRLSRECCSCVVTGTDRRKRDAGSGEPPYHLPRCCWLSASVIDT